MPAIPLHLSRIHAEVLLTLRGPAEQRKVEFYSWVWASGKHGGPRLFQPNEGGLRVLFLRDERWLPAYIGDYPSYDLVFQSSWLPSLLSAWDSGRSRSKELLQRLVALRL
jgi:hypothetical protein